MANVLVAPAANTAAVYTMTANSKRKNTIEGVIFSYSGNPTGGRLSIQAPSGTVIFETDVIAGGEHRLDFPSNCIQTNTNQALIITLAAGGAGITGKLNIINPKTKA